MRSIEQPDVFAVESRTTKRNAIRQINLNPAAHTIQQSQHGEDCVLLCGQNVAQFQPGSDGALNRDQGNLARSVSSSRNAALVASASGGDATSSD